MRRSAEKTGNGALGERGTPRASLAVLHVACPTQMPFSLLDKCHLLQAMPERKAKSLSLSECHIADEILAISDEIVARDQRLEARDCSDRIFQLAEHLEAGLRFDCRG